MENVTFEKIQEANKMIRSMGAFVLSARKFNSEMERHPEWYDRVSTSSGFKIYWGVKLKEAI